MSGRSSWRSFRASATRRGVWDDRPHDAGCPQSNRSFHAARSSAVRPFTRHLCAGDSASRPCWPLLGFELPSGITVRGPCQPSHQTPRSTKMQHRPKVPLRVAARLGPFSRRHGRGQGLRGHPSIHPAGILCEVCPPSFLAHERDRLHSSRAFSGRELPYDPFPGSSARLISL